MASLHAEKPPALRQVDPALVLEVDERPPDRSQRAQVGDVGVIVRMELRLRSVCHIAQYELSSGQHGHPAVWTPREARLSRRSGTSPKPPERTSRENTGPYCALTTQKPRDLQGLCKWAILGSKRQQG